MLNGCDGRAWNAPYPASEANSNTLYSSFSERPKHLDPARSYAANEYAFIGQIYEPPLQYHFLKRPYQLVPLAAEQVPEPQFFDQAGNPLPADAAADQVAFSEYQIEIKPGMRYQPHPALAKDDSGAYRYHHLSEDDIEGINTLADFPHTGTREATAEDFIYQIKRLANPRLHSPIASIMSEYIVGFAEFSRALAAEEESTGFIDLRTRPMAGVTQLDRYRFKIRLHGKYPQFTYWLAMTFFAPMPWEADLFYSQPGLDRRNINLNWYPIGTGPFMLTENNPNLRMVLSRNPNFHGESYPSEGEPEDHDNGMLADAGKPLPLVDKAVYSLEQEVIPRWNKFLQGYYDTSGINSDSFDQAVRFGAGGEASLTEEMQERHIQLATAVETSIFYLGFNMADPVIGGDSEENRYLRQAISIAVNFEEFISIFLNGRGVVAHSPLPPGIFGSRLGPEGINPVVYDLVNGKPKRKSLDEARALLAKAGYPNGKSIRTGRPLVLNYESASAGPDSKAQLNWMRKQFKKLGIQLVIRATDYNRFQEKLRTGTGQLFMFGWNADYPDPENFLFLLYGPNGKVEHAGENAVNYNNPEFNALFDQMKNMENSPERQRIIDRMVDILRHDAPWIWGFYPKAFSLYHDWYGNVKPNLMANNTLKYKRIDPATRVARQQAWNPPVIAPLVLFLLFLLASGVPAVLVYRRHERSAAR
ncbi:peptide ABC transporter substrate-binding protein [Sedimenticola thiotaurini]|uniref:Peptide ABC transporter substrate-binding protein n=1 Tax=Sedimenticola thiotaurini TaxID=1543721 RepID=A0A0F7K2T9_9GAMM|nr:ABC transporter substrate-binding protein [Sedimenticola thiotaurini]AKH22122.1 peptide ABC transporter substrate-binding protein [Sedimenticola thiotaurini]